MSDPYASIITYTHNNQQKGKAMTITITNEVARRRPFGKLMHDVTNETSLDGVLAVAGMDFEVEKVKLHTEPIITDDGVTTVEMPHDMGIIAHRGDELVPYRAVGSGYEVIQYEDAFAPLQYLKDEGFIEAFEQAGTVDQGQRGFVLARLASETTLKDDPTSRFIMFTTSHDGSCSLRAMGWLNRLACANQMPALLGARFGQANMKAKGMSISTIKHTRSAPQLLSSLREAVLVATTGMDVFELELRRMMETEIDGARAEQFTKRLFPFKPGIDMEAAHFGILSNMDRGERIHVSNVRAKRTSLRNLLASPTNENVQRTAAGLFHAAVEYSDYYSGQRASQRILKGSDIPFKSRALELARSI